MLFLLRQRLVLATMVVIAIMGGLGTRVLVVDPAFMLHRHFKPENPTFPLEEGESRGERYRKPSRDSFSSAEQNLRSDEVATTQRPTDNAVPRILQPRVLLGQELGGAACVVGRLRLDEGRHSDRSA